MCKYPLCAPTLFSFHLQHCSRSGLGPSALTPWTPSCAAAEAAPLRLSPAADPSYSPAGIQMHSLSLFFGHISGTLKFLDQGLSLCH